MPSLFTPKALKSFPLAFGPHIQSKRSSRQLMWGTSASLIPVFLASLVFFGWNGLRIFALAIGSAAIYEWLIRGWIAKKAFLRDGSVFLYAALLSCLMAPTVPSWVVCFGSLVMVVMGREVFGGLGQNLFHPTLVGYVTVRTLFPQYVQTPFAHFEATIPAALWPIFFQAHSEMLGGVSIFATGIGGAILIAKKWIHWQTPIFYLLAIAIGSLLIGRSPVEEILNGSIFFGACFLITDPVTAPITGKGRILFASSAGILTVLLRFWASDPEAVASSILLMNVFVPLVDRFIRPDSKGL